MLREGMNGFCMALADSVPGVSGGTVAFILGFYDRFIGSINDFVFGNMEKRKLWRFPEHPEGNRVLHCGNPGGSRNCMA